jgi:glycosyltransferase involved in cell wall biosynthesis
MFERANIAGAACLHLTSEIEAREFDRLRLRAKRVDIVPNGIEMPSDSEPELPLGDAIRSRVLSLGRISWKKGLDRLISAMVYVPGAELVIAGDDDEGYRRKLERLAADLGVAERTSFIGPVHGARKWELIRSCDVFAMPSHSENFGTAALEAMACRRPVIVTPEVGLASTIKETRAGAVVGEPEAIGRVIEKLLRNPAERYRMGEAGWRTAAERFGWSAIAARIEQIYMECQL